MGQRRGVAEDADGDLFDLHEHRLADLADEAVYDGARAADPLRFSGDVLRVGREGAGERAEISPVPRRHERGDPLPDRVLLGTHPYIVRPAVDLVTSRAAADCASPALASGDPLTPAPPL